MKYYLIPSYSMKCRLYPNKEQAKNIDTAIYAVQCYHNCVIWDMFTNYVNTTEKPDKKNPEELIHFPNMRYKENVANHHAALNQRMSRRQGWANIQFRTDRKKNPELQVSKGYEEAKLKLAKLDRKTARKRSWWNNQVTTQIAREHGFIAIETLSVKEMFQNQYIANALSDAAMSQVLVMLAYKAKWYERELVTADQYFASTQICNDCGYQNTALKDSLPKEWTCPNCGVKHDIDINAAKNLLEYAVKQKENKN